MTINKCIFVGLVSSLGLSACATTLPPQIGVEHRASVEEANNKQIVSTAAVEGAPVLDPAMSAAAIQRYLDGVVKEAEEAGGFRPE
jgi:hypothetical protein